MKLIEIKNIARLLFGRTLGANDQQQDDALDRWLGENDRRTRLAQRLADEDYRSRKLDEMRSYDSRRDWPAVKARIDGTNRRNPRRWMRYAAAVALVVGVSSAIYFSLRPAGDGAEVVAQTIAPGSPRAVLVLPDGKSIELDANSGQQTIYYDRNDFVIDRGGEITYTQTDDTARIHEHSVIVPRGGEYILNLPDGSRVWLNADTRLSYPNRFAGSQRRVVLSGEAYFEVAPRQGMPFIVETEGMDIRVLSTAFNVRAYAGELNHTTLVEGRVEVSGAGCTVQITPGEQAVVTDNQVEVHRVDTEEFTGWRQHRFVYRNRPLASVLRDLERWYDIETQLADSAAGELLITANLPRYESMDKIIEVIEFVTGVPCSVSGRRLTVGD